MLTPTLSPFENGRDVTAYFVLGMLETLVCFYFDQKYAQLGKADYQSNVKQTPSKCWCRPTL